MRYGKTYICKSSRQLEFLRRKGFMPFRTSYDFQKPERYVWLFANSEELEAAITEYIEQLDK